MSLPIPGQTIGTMPLYSPTGYNAQPAVGYQGNVQPKQNVIRVDGVEGAYRCALPDNVESIIVIDQYKPLAYMITMNGINRNVLALDIQIHQDANSNVAAASQPDSNNVDLAAMLTAINDKLNSMEVTVNELKSTNRHFKQDNKRSKSNSPDKSCDGTGDNSASDPNS